MRWVRQAAQAAWGAQAGEEAGRSQQQPRAGSRQPAARPVGAGPIFLGSDVAIFCTIQA